jgi:hypothetical protein
MTGINNRASRPERTRSSMDCRILRRMAGRTRFRDASLRSIFPSSTVMILSSLNTLPFSVPESTRTEKTQSQSTSLSPPSILLLTLPPTRLSSTTRAKIFPRTSRRSSSILASSMLRRPRLTPATETVGSTRMSRLITTLTRPTPTPTSLSSTSMSTRPPSSFPQAARSSSTLSTARRAATTRRTLSAAR